MFQQTCRTFAFDTRSPRSIGAIRSVRVNLGRNTGTKPNYKIILSVFAMLDGFAMLAKSCIQCLPWCSFRDLGGRIWV